MPTRKTLRPFYVALQAAGATVFCPICHAYVTPQHSIHWPTSAFKPATAKLQGGLDRWPRA